MVVNRVQHNVMLMREKEQLKVKNRKAFRAPKIISLTSQKDLAKIRAYGRFLAAEIGFDKSEQSVIVTAISEICRNVIEHAQSGEVIIEGGDPNNDRIVITVSDNGPGIKDLKSALKEGFSSGEGLGVGLPGAKRVMDEFHIESEVGKGTTVKMTKWLNNKSDTR